MVTSVKHQLKINWKATALGSLPRLTNTVMALNGLQFSFSCERNPGSAKYPFQLLVEVARSSVEYFDERWSIVLRLKNMSRHLIFTNGCRRAPSYAFMKYYEADVDEWFLLEFDAHVFRPNFDDELCAANCGNDYRIDLLDDGSSVWVKREYLVADSEYFRELLQLPENSNGLQVEGVSKTDFLEYAYFIHKPTLELSPVRAGRVWGLAVRFQNQIAVSTCEMFLREFQPKDPTQRCQQLVGLDRLGMTTEFTQALNNVKQGDLKSLDASAAAQFSSQNLRQILVRLRGNNLLNVGASSAFGLLRALYDTVRNLLNYVVGKSGSWPKKPEFSNLLDIKTARRSNFDCTIIIPGHESTPIYVKKSLLAMHSEYFKALFFGDFVEATMDTITLKDVDFNQFLEYLVEVYAPSPPLTITRVEIVLTMADRFLNQHLLERCGDFLKQNRMFSPAEKVKALCLADEFNLERAFSVILAKLNGDLKSVDFSVVAQFHFEHRRQFLECCIKRLP